MDVKNAHDVSLIKADDERHRTHFPDLGFEDEKATQDIHRRHLVGSGFEGKKLTQDISLTESDDK
jgi:hypothetical protein